ncbi:MAG TPA: FkbM family methyltransferase [Chitinophagaceae bacterium]|nr:FkbM family methyltransferase [Chitinophagaceae bacterium]
MQTTFSNYRPSLKNGKQYIKYFFYFREYLIQGDFKSIFNSFQWVIRNKLPRKDYQLTSKMGRFIARKQTTDFQFPNFAYESEVKKYIKNNLNSFDLFIDVGACMGEYCIWLANSGKEVIAFEPISFSALENNAELNNIKDKIVIFPVGCGRKSEKVNFNIPSSLISSSHIDRKTKEGKSVEIVTLDQYLGYIPQDKKILLKLDVEGMECEVIEGGKNFISQHNNIQIIYEHFKSDNFRNDNALLQCGDFSFENLDEVNRLAIKKFNS